MVSRKYVAPRAAADAPPKKTGKEKKGRPEGMSNTEWAF
jgi:hypothetical protein